MPASTEKFPRDTTGLPTVSATGVVELADGDRVTLHIGPVAKRIGDATVRMLAYNGSIPGPTLRVPQGAEVLVDIENEGDMENTVHWHGLRLENRFDGTHETQDAIPVGGRFTDVHRATSSHAPELAAIDSWFTGNVVPEPSSSALALTFAAALLLNRGNRLVRH